MARDNAIGLIKERVAAAAAATSTTYQPVGERPFICKSFEWFYESTEANADNTLDWAITYTVDGTTFVVVLTNANAVGLLNTASPLVSQKDMGDAVASGGAAVAKTAPSVRIPANAIVRFVIVTAGTGTIPAVQAILSGWYV